jgi:hypothetical protein
VHSRDFALAFLLLLPGVNAMAQQVSIAASVPLASPIGAGVRNLAFGAATPIPGQTLEIDVPAAQPPISGTVHAGEFRFNVASVRGLDFALTVPSTLGAPGLTPLPVTFGGLQYGGYCVTAGGSACTLTGFDPAAASNVRVCFQIVGSGSCHPNRVFPPGSELAIYVGGRLSVPAAALPGVYSATVTLTIVQVH